MKILVDGMGGDNAPLEIVKGAIEAAKEIDDEICIIGRERDIYAALGKCKYKGDRIKVIDAPEVIATAEPPVKAVRTKKDSSMVRGITMVRDGEADAFISAGNSGALMAGGLLILGRIRGIDRPAIASPYPTIKNSGISLLIDAGANSECRPQNLLEFGIMGSIYMQEVLGRDNPRVGLVSIGAEDSKGSTLTKAAFDLLEQSPLNFVGNVEAREIPEGVCDVIVCDGFVGNVILKLTEGLAWNILKLLKRKFTEGAKATMGALLLKGKLKGMVKDFDYSSYGGAPILGVRGPILKIHGTSEASAVKNAIIKAVPYVRENVVDTIQTSVLDIEEMSANEEMDAE